MEFLKPITDKFGLIIFISILISLLYILRLVIEFIMQKNTIGRQNQASNFNIREIINAREPPTQESEICVLCHDPITDKVELDCKHKYCIKCIMEYSRNYTVLPCPACHKKVYLINPLKTIKNNSTSEYYDMITEYNNVYLSGNNYVKLLDYIVLV